MKIQTECRAVETVALLMVDNYKLGVVLNWKAEGSGRVLTEVSMSQAACSNETCPILEFAPVVRVTRNTRLRSLSNAVYGIS